jgi:hypothetical protein
MKRSFEVLQGGYVAIFGLEIMKKTKILDSTGTLTPAVASRYPGS